MKTLCICLTLLVLSACATPITVMKNGKDQVAVCGGNTSGSFALGAIGYHLQKNQEKDCVEAYKKAGFETLETENTQPEKE